jgi:hypothetical protein
MRILESNLVVIGVAVFCLTAIVIFFWKGWRYLKF